MSELKHKLSALTEQLRNSEAVHYTIMYPRHIELLKSISMHTPHLPVQEAAAARGSLDELNKSYMSIQV